MPDLEARFQRISERMLAVKDVLARSGSIVESWRQRGERRFGPYFKVIYRIDGRQCAIYLGRCAALADKVRGLLAELKAPRLAARQLADMRRAAKAAWRQVRAHVNETLRPAGMYLDGYLLRGWYRWRRRQTVALSQERADLWWDNVCLRVGSFDVIMWKSGRFDDQLGSTPAPPVPRVKPRHLRLPGDRDE